MRKRNEALAYQPRRPDIAQVNFSIDREARTLLTQYAGGGKAIGRFVTRLVFEHHARVQERERVQEVLQSMLDTSTKAG
jgi:hypothetical protein